ncbi:MAG: hypothetical protein J0I12_06045 [Candidatus Eremiobacteraeota bacterium]|nr:hypothetical protein [Candidatus Eremiobacteraeota bacterium]
MNDYEAVVAGCVVELERLLQEGLEWVPPDAASHNRWADERQPRFVELLERAREGLQSSGRVVRERKRRPERVQAWTSEAVASPYEYRVESDQSRIGAVFAGQVVGRLLELERAWDERLEVLYRLSRR